PNEPTTVDSIEHHGEPPVSLSGNLRAGPVYVTRREYCDRQIVINDDPLRRSTPGGYAGSGCTKYCADTRRTSTNLLCCHSVDAYHMVFRLYDDRRAQSQAWRALFGLLVAISREKDGSSAWVEINA